MEEKPKRNLRYELLSWGKAIVFAVAAALVINNVLIVNAEIPTGSMETTIMTGDRVMANRLAYLGKPPERFDIVVFKFPDDESRIFVKRVIGLPGETVEIQSNKVYIDGTLLEDSEYVSSFSSGDYGPFKVPEHHYFMLGDNRSDSLDSKNWEDPFVEDDKIMGKVMFRYYPGIKALK